MTKPTHIPVARRIYRLGEHPGAVVDYVLYEDVKSAQWFTRDVVCHEKPGTWTRIHHSDVPDLTTARMVGFVRSVTKPTPIPMARRIYRLGEHPGAVVDYVLYEVGEPAQWFTRDVVCHKKSGVPRRTGTWTRIHHSHVPDLATARMIGFARFDAKILERT
jgi:hypothetical protein